MGKEQQNTRPVRKVDPIDYDETLIALNKARAMAHILERLGEPDGLNNLVCALDDADTPAGTREWLHSIVASELRSALDEIEAKSHAGTAQSPAGGV